MWCAYVRRSGCFHFVLAYGSCCLNLNLIRLGERLAIMVLTLILFCCRLVSRGGSPLGSGSPVGAHSRPFRPLRPFAPSLVRPFAPRLGPPLAGALSPLGVRGGRWYKSRRSERVKESLCFYGSSHLLATVLYSESSSAWSANKSYQSICALRLGFQAKSQAW